MPETAPSAKIFRFSPALAIFGIVIVTSLGLRAYEMWRQHRVIRVEAALRGKTFVVEVADTDAKKELGLGKRDSLPADQGMYFPFGSAQRLVFWMKGMRFPIDIVWIRDGKVVGIDASVPVATTEKLETYSPVEAADAVLELNAGTAASLQLSTGDEVRLEPHL